MAGNDWEQQVHDKIKHLAGDDTRWLVRAGEALSHAGKITKKLFVSAADDTALKIVKDLMELRAEVLEAGTASGKDAAADNIDHTADIVRGIMQDMGRLDKPPRNAAEFGALLEDRDRLKVPVVPPLRRRLQPKLTADELQLLQALPGQDVTVNFSFLLAGEPYAAAMQQLLSTVLFLLGKHSGMKVLPKVRGNLSERGASSVSSVVRARLRPDCIVVCKSCTVMIGEDKEAGKLQQAMRDIESYAQNGLPAAQYGKVPGIPAYAAAGTELQFLYIKRDGTVLPAGPLLDLSTASGRLAALCAVIQLYRVIVAIDGTLPRLVHRVILWYDERRDEASRTGVTLTPSGAIKTIRRFEILREEHGVTEKAIKAAYKAAAAARTKQLAMGQKPFLVSPSKGPDFTGGGLRVHTQPLGYQRSINTEEDARHVVRSCLRAACVLHAAGVVHTDLRLANTVWLDEKHCMVIDLEHCRPAHKRLPDSAPNLVSWDGGLVLEKRGGGRYYTPMSDLYQIGQLLEQLQEEQPQLRSEPANNLVRLLKCRKSAADPAKPLTAEEALQHAWLREEEQHGDSGDAEGDEGGSRGGVRAGKRKRGRAVAAAGDGPQGGKRRKGEAPGQGKGTGGKGSSRKGAKG